MGRMSLASRSLALAALTAILLSTPSPASASTAGGLMAGPLGGATAETRSLTSATLEWNVGVTGADARRAVTVRLSTGAGETLRAGDVVSATVDGGASGTCTGAATAAAPSAAIDIAFDGCALELWDLAHVAVTVTGAGGATVIAGDLGGVHGTLSAFSGEVIDPASDIAVRFDAQPHEGVETFSHLYLDIPRMDPLQLVGRRLVVVLEDPAGGSRAVYAGTVGAAGAIRAEAAGDGSASSTVTVDVRALSDETGWAPVREVTRYRLALLADQRLTAHGEPSYAALTAAGTFEDGGGPAPVTWGTEPVALDPRLTYSEPAGPVRLGDPTALRFCYSFRVTNTSSEPVDWEVAFDTTKPPLWGLDPTVVDPGGVGTLTSMWNAQTRSYDPATGLWTLAGVDWNRTLPAATPANPAPSTEVGYCAHAEVPAADPATYDPPQISVDPASSAYHVALRVRVTSPSPLLVPWEAEIDLADVVCAATLPAQLTGENATLTHLGGTRYLLRGTSAAATRFVSATQTRDFVFARYNPGGLPYQPGTCH